MDSIELQKLIFQFDADDTLLKQKFTGVTKSLLETQASERAAAIEQLGIIQKLKVEADLLRKARERSQDPRQVQAYTERLRALNQEARNLTGALQPKGSTIFDSIKAGLGFGAGFSIVQGLQRATGLMTDLGKASLKAASAAEQNRNAYRTMLGSRTEAAKLEGKIIDLVKQTPFELTDANDFVKRLLAMGIASKDVVKDLKSLGDIAAGVGI